MKSTTLTQTDVTERCSQVMIYPFSGIDGEVHFVRQYTKDGAQVKPSELEEITLLQFAQALGIGEAKLIEAIAVCSKVLTKTEAELFSQEDAKRRQDELAKIEAMRIAAEKAVTKKKEDDK